MFEETAWERSGKHKKISLSAVIAFFLALSLCSLLIGCSIRNKSVMEKVTMEQLIMEKSIKTGEVISRLLHKTQALSALVIQSNGKIEAFERVAATLIDDPAILNLLTAPGGIVSDVYPQDGNEKLIGYDLFGDGAGNREAVMARDTGKLVFGGPFHLMQGGEALVGRLPVWLDGPNGEKHFWGLVSVTLKYPDALIGAGLESLETHGFAYEIWRINPDDGKRQIIANSSYDYNKRARFIERHVPILNADWYFRISPVREWYQYTENWLLIFIGFCMSFLTAFVAQNNHELKRMKNNLEDLLQTDSLTGLYNRQGLFRRLQSLISQKKAFQLCYIDLNYFKQINDTYGHNAGDLVLVEFSRRISRLLREEDVFARISGDEFVLVHIGETAEAFCEYLERIFEEPIRGGYDGNIHLTFSYGIVVFPAEGENIDDLISVADKKMYQQKRDKYDAERRRRATDLHLQNAGKQGA